MAHIKYFSMAVESGRPAESHQKETTVTLRGESLDTRATNPGIPGASARPERTFPITTPARYTDVAVTQAAAFRGAGIMGALAEATPEIYATKLDTSGSLEALEPNLKLLDEADKTQRDLAESAKTLATFGGNMRRELAKASEHYDVSVAGVARQKEQVARVDELAVRHPALAGARANEEARAALDKAAAALADLPDSLRQRPVGKSTPDLKESLAQDSGMIEVSVEKPEVAEVPVEPQAPVVVSEPQVSAQPVVEPAVFVDKPIPVDLISDEEATDAPAVDVVKPITVASEPKSEVESVLPPHPFTIETTTIDGKEKIVLKYGELIYTLTKHQQKLAEAIQVGDDNAVQTEYLAEVLYGDPTRNNIVGPLVLGLRRKFGLSGPQIESKHGKGYWYSEPQSDRPDAPTDGDHVPPRPDAPRVVEPAVDAPHVLGEKIAPLGDITAGDVPSEVGSVIDAFPESVDMTLQRNGEEVEVNLSADSAIVAGLLAEGVTNKKELIAQYVKITGGDRISQERFEEQIMHNLREELASSGLDVSYQIAKGEYRVAAIEPREGKPVDFEGSYSNLPKFSHEGTEVRGRVGAMLDKLDPFNEDRALVTVKDLMDAASIRTFPSLSLSLQGVRKWLAENGKMIEEVRGRGERRPEHRIVVRDAEPHQGEIAIVGEHMIRDGIATLLEPDEYRIAHQLRVGVTEDSLQNTLTYRLDTTPRPVADVVASLNDKAGITAFGRYQAEDLVYFSRKGIKLDSKGDYIPTKPLVYLDSLQMLLQGGNQTEVLSKLNETRKERHFNGPTAAKALERTAMRLLNRGRAGLAQEEREGNHPSEMDLYQQLEAVINSPKLSKNGNSPEEKLLIQINKVLGRDIPFSQIRRNALRIDLDAPAVGAKVREAHARKAALDNPTIFSTSVS